MNSVDVRSQCDIQPVVHENFCWGSGSGISNLTYEFVQGSSFEIFFADLDHIHFVSDRGVHVGQEVPVTFDP